MVFIFASNNKKGVTMKINGVMKLSLAALSAMMMAACSSSSSGGGSTSASTWNLSGTVRIERSFFNV